MSDLIDPRGPKLCGRVGCTSVLSMKDGERPSKYRDRTFCSLSCSARQQQRSAKQHRTGRPQPKAPDIDPHVLAEEFAHFAQFGLGILAICKKLGISRDVARKHFAGMSERDAQPWRDALAREAKQRTRNGIYVEKETAA